MDKQIRMAIKLMEDLTERSKELACLYAIEECLKDPDKAIETVCNGIIQAIPPGWQYPEACLAGINLEGEEYYPQGLKKTSWKLHADIVQQERAVGNISVYYTREMPPSDIGPFLKEEQKLIQTIADRLSHFMTYRKMKQVLQDWQVASRDHSESRRGDWEAVLDLIRQTDNALFLRIAYKMLNHLCWSGIDEAEALRVETTHPDKNVVGPLNGETKHPRHDRLPQLSTEYTERIFRMAANHLSDEEILSRIHRWIQEDKLSAMLRTVHRHLPLSEVYMALRRYFTMTHEEAADRYPLAKGLKVFLIGRILSSRPKYINLLKKHVEIEDLYHLMEQAIISEESQGNLGGKSAGFFLASKIIEKSGSSNGPSLPVRVPKTWYISTDMMLYFMRYNNLDEIVEQKYKEVERVRLEYPYILRAFEHSAFPPEMEQGLSLALNDLGDNPLIVRPSSLLEERLGSEYGGRYKSVFLANQGGKEQRLGELMRAVAEVYASNFGPDPITSRADRGLLDISEQLGVIIQEIVGVRVGHYYFPAFSGVARSRNEFRWLPEVKEEDGVAWVVPGLRTRAVARAGDEQPVLVVPGHPSLNVTESEQAITRAPMRFEAINLETCRLETIELSQFTQEHDVNHPWLGNIADIDGFIARSPFTLQLRNLLRVLEKNLGVPVEIEFASDGEHLHLIQCRPLPAGRTSRPAPIPKDLSGDRIVFSMSQNVLNGWVSNISHIVYVDRARYATLEDHTDREGVLEAVKRLNELLPRKRFILIAPCSWYVRSERRDGMDLQCTELSNAAVLVDLQRQAGDREGTPSYGLPFLQDLAASGICYLPTFPDAENTLLNDRFLRGARNLLQEMLPECATGSEVIRVIDVAKSADGRVLKVLMNAELNEALGILTDPEDEIGDSEEEESFEIGHSESYWRWRHRMAEQVASQLDPERFGVVGAYVFGSTKNGTAGPASDIDLLVHFRGTETQQEDLTLWFEGWSLCLDEINYLRTGYRSGGLLDVHIVTDEDIAKRSSYAVKIDAVTDAAAPLKIKSASSQDIATDNNDKPTV